ncbi:PREDICTED: LRR receptor-like serine/threonine-protein kinase GSO2 [Nelumbo nucifera]|uniref:LRR receptor-like serine/threonine-protein kinase GSO2 n=1 Tax=Nelumbo nucifera TaxID=4432 RepID=A0A1U7ZNS4_NELNU|nr:PREDICTED: LRR receptor-like serine/threonine-protein kinase GSO2 [Nelumbo nucifera]
MENMESPWMTWSWISLLLLVQLRGYWGCMEEERMALLEFKSSFNATDYIGGAFLPSWVDDKGSDCCTWERVICSPTTGRITQLSLNDVRDNNLGPAAWYLNTTLFLPFEELLYLDLSGIFNGCFRNEGGRGRVPPGLKKLQVLNLSDNQLNSSILPFLGALTSLETLSLRSNELEGSLPLREFSQLRNLKILDLSQNRLGSGSLTIQGNFTKRTVQYTRLPPIQGVKRLSKLERLDLSENHFDKSILKFVGAFPSLNTLSLGSNGMEGSLSAHALEALSKLEILDLSYNSFTWSIPPSIGNLSSLKHLSLAYNRFNGSLPIQGLCKLKSLQDLVLGGNSFEGVIPSCLSNLTSLRMLDLSENQLRGSIPSSLITSLTSLEYISLENNNFEGAFWFGSFANSSRLEVVKLSSGGNKLEVQTEYPSWVPSFQLKVLVLTNCNLNKPAGIIPKFLSLQYDLREIDLSHNSLRGNLPSWLLHNKTKLELLNVQNNSLTGHLNLTSRLSLNISWLFISENHFHGQLPANIGEVLPNLEVLHASQNNFEGSIPSSIGEMRNLFTLDLSNNNFSGEIPEQLAIGCQSLVSLKLSNNKLQGQIFPKLSNLTRLIELYLDGNHFSGNALNGAYEGFLLVRLDIGNNYISGKIPSWIGNFTGLVTLDMRDNLFEGHIPTEIGNLKELYLLDLSGNFLSGPIPLSSDSPSLRFIHLGRNGFRGSLPISLLNSSSSLVTLDIGGNNFSGHIPYWIGEFSELRILLFEGNNLQGPIPPQLCQLKKIRIMDLSNNTISGSIPKCFSDIPFGRSEFREYMFMETGAGTRYSLQSYKYQSVVEGNNDYDADEVFENKPEKVKFTTKRRSNSYEGSILDFMSGLDLSSNLLTGEIPPEMGNLNEILALNLSHNQFSGSISKSFSNLTQIESLDLSHNNLSGQIPLELTELPFLAIFSVAYNNLSGKTPDMKAQFATFDIDSYEGNPFLCGPPLLRNCTTGVESKVAPATYLDDGMDLVSFYASFAVSYVMCLLALAFILYINSYWRRIWFGLIEAGIYSCYDFVFTTVHKFSSHRRT